MYIFLCAYVFISIWPWRFNEYDSLPFNTVGPVFAQSPLSLGGTVCNCNDYVYSGAFLYHYKKVIMQTKQFYTIITLKSVIS